MYCLLSQVPVADQKVWVQSLSRCYPVYYTPTTMGELQLVYDVHQRFIPAIGVYTFKPLLPTGTDILRSESAHTVDILCNYRG